MIGGPASTAIPCAPMAPTRRMPPQPRAPSFYAAFGSKEELFKEAVELYHKIQGAPIVKALLEAPTACASIEAWLHAAAKSICQADTPHGCLMVLGAINCMPANKGIEDFMREQRSLREKFIRQRLRRGIAEGDMPAGADVNTLASFYVSIIDGLSIRARDGASRKALFAIVECAMVAWDGLVLTETPWKAARLSRCNDEERTVTETQSSPKLHRTGSNLQTHVFS